MTTVTAPETQSTKDDDKKEPTVLRESNGVVIMQAAKPLKIKNPELGIEIEATPRYPQFKSLQDAVNFANGEENVLEGVNTFVRNSVYSNIRQRIRTAPVGSKIADVVSGAEAYGENWTFDMESEAIKKSELLERQSKAIAMLEAAENGENVDPAAILALLRGAK
jgi:hypothetical protein